MQTNNLKVEYVNIEDIKPHPQNAKLHPEVQVEQIKYSIQRYGMIDPIGVWNGVVVEGHGRLIACRELGLTQVPVIRLDHLTDEERREYMLVHNQTTMNSGWDAEALARELENLDFGGFDFGFEYDFAEEQKEAKEDDFDVDKELQQPVFSKLGDLWQLGRHRLICGDSTDKAVIERLMDGAKADMVFTDPPWNVNYGAVDKDNAQGYKPRTILNDFMGTDDFKKFMYKAFSVMNAA